VEGHDPKKIFRRRIGAPLSLWTGASTFKLVPVPLRKSDFKNQQGNSALQATHKFHCAGFYRSLDNKFATHTNDHGVLYLGAFKTHLSFFFSHSVRVRSAPPDHRFDMKMLLLLTLDK